jgi:hypothetical protein
LLLLANGKQPPPLRSPWPRRRRLCSVFRLDPFKWGGPQATQRFDDIGQAVIAYIAAVACAIAAIRHIRQTRLAWALIAASAFSWATGEVVWSYFELIRGQEVPFPSYADLGYLLAVPLTIAGILLFPSAPIHLTSRLRTIVDGLLIAASLLIISWATVLGPVYRASSGHLLSDLIGLAYPIGDVVIGMIVMILAAPARVAPHGVAPSLAHGGEGIARWTREKLC